MSDHRKAFEAITADPRYLANLDWGESRPGHPEGTVRAHILFAPVAVFVEWVPTQPSTLELELEAGGPLLYGLYAALLVSRRRRRNVSIAAAAHVLCFMITLWQLDVL